MRKTWVDIIVEIGLTKGYVVAQQKVDNLCNRCPGTRTCERCEIDYAEGYINKLYKQGTIKAVVR